MRLRRFGFAVALLTILSVSALGRAAFSGASDSQVGFEASGPAGLKITGSTSDLAAAEDGGNVTITVALAHLTTGIGLRDQHMRDKYLEVGKFPVATLTMARSALKVPASGERTEADAQGTLTLHGQTRPVTVHYDSKGGDSKGGGAGLVTHGKLRINMNDFGITVPTYLGVTVKPDVEVGASFRLTGT